MVALEAEQLTLSHTTGERGGRAGHQCVGRHAAAHRGPEPARRHPTGAEVATLEWNHMTTMLTDDDCADCDDDDMMIMVMVMVMVLKACI